MMWENGQPYVPGNIHKYSHSGGDFLPKESKSLRICFTLWYSILAFGNLYTEEMIMDVYKNVLSLVLL